MSTRIKYGENPFVGFNPVLKRLQERGFKGVIVPRMNVFPELPTLLQEKFHLKTQTSLRIGSRFEITRVGLFTTTTFRNCTHLEVGCGKP